MPIWLREFTFKKILKHYESKNEDNGKSWLEGDVRKEAMKINAKFRSYKIKGSFTDT